MKKRIIVVLSFLLIFAIISASFTIKATDLLTINENLELTNDAKSACLIEIKTGKIIYSKNENEKLAPASMTKIMTMILVMEKIEQGTIKLEDMVITPKEASSLGGSQIYLSEGEQMSVNDLIKSMAIASANDATMSLAMHIGGSEKMFVKMMNDKTNEMGLQNTNFVNPYGFDHDDHYSSAYDMATMAKYLITNYPDILKYTSIYEDYVREDTVKKFWLVNTNKLVRFVNEVDGLKTGHTDKSGYCLTATMKKNNERFIAVSMGNTSPKTRNNEIMNMLNYGVNNYETKVLVKKGDVIKEIEDKGYSPNRIILKAEKDVVILKMKNEKNKEIKIEENIDLKNDKSLLTVFYGDEKIDEIKLISEEEIKRANVLELLLEVIKEIFLITD